MAFLQFGGLRLALLASCAVALAPATALAQIRGQTMGNTVSANPLNAHPQTRDDRDVTRSIAITSINMSALITQSAAAFPATLNNLVFAGAPGIGMNFTPIAAADFNIRTYTPWVVTSPNLNSPSGMVTYNRGVIGQDAGGLNILFDYTPGGTDPTTINFLQAFSVTSPNLNNGNAIVAMDNGGRGSPYYNNNGASGVGMGDRNGVPLNIPNGSNAWFIDTPYVCESGFSNNGMGCPATTARNDETITSYIDRFDLFVESDRVFQGKTYQVLFGGFNWGFDFSATDIPEPTTWLMLTVGFGALGASLRRRRVLAAVVN